MQTKRFMWKAAVMIVAALAIASCDFPMDLDMDFSGFEDFEIFPSGNPTWPSGTGSLPSFSQYNLVAAATDGNLVTAVGDRFAFLDSSRIWRKLPISGYYCDVAWADTVFVAVGPGMSVGFSDNGEDWKFSQITIDSVSDYYLKSVAWSGKILAVTAISTAYPDQENAIFVLDDNGSWDMIGPFDSVASLTKIVWADSRFVAFGQCDSCATATSIALESTDCLSWTKHEGPAHPSFSDVIWCGDRFLAAAGREVFSSIDGIEWTTVAHLSGDVRGLYRYESTYLAVGRSGHISISHDGATWEKVTSPAYKNLYGAIYAGGKYYVFGVASIFSSDDGLKWTACMVN